MTYLIIAAVLFLSTALGGVVVFDVPLSSLTDQVTSLTPNFKPVTQITDETSPISSATSLPKPTIVVPPITLPPEASSFNLNQELAKVAITVGPERLLFFTDTNYLGALAGGESGQFLQSQGAGQLPQWANITTNTTIQNISNTTNTTNNVTNVTGGVDANWGSPGSIGTTTPNSAVFTGVTLAGATYPLQVGSSNQFQVTNSGRLQVAYVGDSGYLSSSGGVIFLNNTSNVGTGIGIYSNAGTEALGNMINVKVDNPLYNQAAFYMNYDGLSNAVEIVSNSEDFSSNALAVTGHNINDSTVGIIGYELARGTIKVSHYRPTGGTDTNASALSIDLKGVGTRAQGIYVDSTETGGTLGNLLRLRNESIDKFVVNYQGNLTIAGNIVQGANGSTTSYTKVGSSAGDEFFVGSNASFRVQRAASNSEAFRVQIAGDTQGRWVGTSDGRLRWGDGTNATDVTLRRTGVGTVTLEGNLAVTGTTTFNGDITHGASGTDTTFTKYGNTAGDQFFIGTNGAFRSQRSLANSEAFRVQVSGDTQGRLVVTSDGRLTWGSGALAGDVVLRRGTVGVLWLEGSLIMNNSNADADTIIKGMSDGNLLYADASVNAIGIGTSAPLAGLHIHKNGNDNAILIVNQLGSADLMTASASGATRFRVTNNGSIISPTGSLGVGTSEFGDNAAHVIAIASSTAPTTSITNGVQLYTIEETGFHRLKLRDEEGNATTISPHNFSLIPDGPSENLAWSYYSERDNQAINADITRALRLVEGLTGQQLVYEKNLGTGTYLESNQPRVSLAETPLFQELQKYSQANDLDLTATLADYVKKSELASHLTFQEKVINLVSEAIFQAKTRFEQTATFMAEAVFNRGVTINGPLTLSGETTGWAEIPAGAKRIGVKFKQPTGQIATIYLDAAAIGTAVRVDDVTTQGFVMTLDEALTSSARIKWLAVINSDQAGSEVQVLEGVGQLEKTDQSMPISSPGPQVTPNQKEAEPDVTEVVETSPESSISAQPLPSSAQPVSPGEVAGVEDSNEQPGEATQSAINSQITP